MADVCDSCEARGYTSERHEVPLADGSRGVDLCDPCYQGLFGERDRRIAELERRLEAVIEILDKCEVAFASRATDAARGEGGSDG